MLRRKVVCTCIISTELSRVNEISLDFSPNNRSAVELFSSIHHKDTQYETHLHDCCFYSSDFSTLQGNGDHNEGKVEEEQFM